MTPQQLRTNGALLFECISGSHAYGLAHAHSDVDKRGVFVLPRPQFYGLRPTEQVNDANNDETYYELRKFGHLLAKNNPNLLEILLSPEDCIQYRHPLFLRFRPADFISRLCEGSFAGYALSQIKKARGLNKKISHPVDRQRKSVLDFCYVNRGMGAQALTSFLAQRDWEQMHCGLVRIQHMPDYYALFYDPEGAYSGVMSSPRADEVTLSSVPKGASPVAYLYFNRGAYSTYCKDYRQYWEWVEKRNEHRYQNTLEHGKNYDAKNMMHTFRLLHLAEEIARTGRFELRRTRDVDFLWRIRRGAFEYEELVRLAEEKIATIRDLFAHSDLPERPDPELVDTLLYEVRRDFYGKKG